MSDGLDTLRRRVNELAQDRPELERVASECDLYGHHYEVRDRGAFVKEPCRYPLPDGRRCLECETCQPVGRTGLRRVPESVFCPRCGLSWKVER